MNATLKIINSIPSNFLKQYLILNLPTATEDDCIALHGRCKGKKKAG